MASLILPGDTSLAAARMHTQVIGRLPASRRLAMALDLSRVVRALAAAGARKRRPEADSTESSDMNQDDFLLLLAQSLDGAGIPFMVVGSLASSYHGQPRSTNDVDLVIDPEPAALEQWLDQLGDAYYVSREAACDALRQRGMFNVIHLAEGWKADLIVRKNRPFSVEEFRRREQSTLGDRQVPIASAEDIILSKLEWNRISPSERQVRDAMNVAATVGDQLDQAYLRQWAEALGVTEVLEELLRSVTFP
jgi:hypothetical protein